MAYKKTIWVNDQTPLNADNMNNIENGIAKNEEDIAGLAERALPKTNAEGTGSFKWTGLPFGIYSTGNPLTGPQPIFTVDSENGAWFRDGLKIGDSVFTVDIGGYGFILISKDGTEKKLKYDQSPEGDILTSGNKGVANGVASLGADGKVPNGQLPTKYRHTVVLKLYGGGTNPMAVVSFTDYSDSETPITDYSKLHTTFGGKIISVNGLVSVHANSEWQTAAPCTLDLTGGTMATDKLNIVYAVTTNPIPKTLAELSASTFTVEDTVSPF